VHRHAAHWQHAERQAKVGACYKTMGHGMGSGRIANSGSWDTGLGFRSWPGKELRGLKQSVSRISVGAALEHEAHHHFEKRSNNLTNTSGILRAKTGLRECVLFIERTS